MADPDIEPWGEKIDRLLCLGKSNSPKDLLSFYEEVSAMAYYPDERDWPFPGLESAYYQGEKLSAAARANECAQNPTGLVKALEKSPPVKSGEFYRRYGCVKNVIIPTHQERSSQANVEELLAKISARNYLTHPDFGHYREVLEKVNPLIDQGVSKIEAVKSSMADMVGSDDEYSLFECSLLSDEDLLRVYAALRFKFGLTSILTETVVENKEPDDNPDVPLEDLLV